MLMVSVVDINTQAEPPHHVCLHGEQRLTSLP